jgi:hypothetical protein
MLTISSAKSIFATLTSAVGGASNTSLYSIKHLKHKLNPTGTISDEIIKT